MTAQNDVEILDSQETPKSSKTPSRPNSESGTLILIKSFIEVKAIASTVGSLADSIASYVTGVQNVINPVLGGLKTLNAGILFRNSTEQNQLAGLVKKANLFVKELKELKDKPINTRYAEQLEKMEKTINHIHTGLGTNTSTLSTIQAFLVGCTTGPVLRCPKSACLHPDIWTS